MCAAIAKYYNVELALKIANLNKFDKTVYRNKQAFESVIDQKDSNFHTNEFFK